MTEQSGFGAARCGTRGHPRPVREPDGVVRDTWLVFQGPLGCRLRHLHTQVGEKGNGGKEKTAGVGKGDSHDTWHNVHIRKESADGRGREGLAQGQGGEWHHVGLWKLCPGEVCDKKKKMRGGGGRGLCPAPLYFIPCRLRVSDARVSTLTYVYWPAWALTVSRAASARARAARDSTERETAI